ncbi:alpha-1,4-glucan--maltose-1-phosphate maltosyltransferase [Glaciibacter flavus]|uniref:alpha-1,4-glucan--maltose-1-phosphate maltosyltransferase n=1 Tax=Orlajensenia flava TaxID=2565934 RepID=UPI003AFF87A5
MSSPQIRAGRIPVFDLSPQLADDLWPAKAFAGEVVPFAATAFREGHDRIGVELLLTSPSGVTETRRMVSGPTGTDRWLTSARLDEVGEYRWRVRAFADDYLSWLHDADIKIPAGIDVELMLLIGSELFARAALDADRPQAQRRALRTASQAMTDVGTPSIDRLALARADRLRLALHHHPVTRLSTHSAERVIRVERTRAGVGAWYEFFPRSEGAERRRDGSWKSGNFRTAAARLPQVAAMGFDVLYLPPIHPIGRAFRKGPNNTLDAGPNDPGSPWAIGSAEGGHDAIHPDLGTSTDFRYFLKKAKEAGLEVALDFALQASPDHPWVAEHPEWFTTLPDGTIAYAENPPKKYQDIYPINFDNDPEGIRAESLRILRHWIGQGIRIFRVDNPHTKPLDFWEWIIGTVNAEYPDVVFLAEAFTRPALMRALAKVGFQQSYSYFTWRNTKEELEEFLTSVSTTTADFMRPNLFVNTPDILTEYLQFGGPAAFTIRAAIAAMAAPLWGVYSGFELFEAVARPGAEESIDNEKYEYRPRDFAAAETAGRSLALFIGILNRIRAEHPALRQLRNIRFHHTDDPAILAFSKHLPAEFTGTGSADTVFVVVNVDPHSVRETTVHVDTAALGFGDEMSFGVVDLVTGDEWTWGPHNYVRLDAFANPVHILQVNGADV